MPDDNDDLLLGPGGDLSKEYVQRRVDDWLNRLNQLFCLNRNWAGQQGWSIDDSGGTELNQDTMREVGVPPVVQPVQRLDTLDGSYALFRPKGLWVIGANGRIDLYTSKGAFVLIDRADALKNPVWRLFRSSAERGGVAYEPALLTELV